VDITQQQIIINNYCSIHLIRHLDSLNKERLLDYDPFLNSQIIMLECLKTLTIKKDSVMDNLYYVSYNLPNQNNDLITIKLIIVKENGAYKIENIFSPRGKKI